MDTAFIYFTVSDEASGALLRRAASRFTGLDPAVFDTRREKGKKPAFVRFPALFFSVSHSGGVWAAAFSRGCPVGLDIQKTVVPGHSDGIARRYFHPNEREAYLRADDRTAAFLRIWSRKEAAVKVSGRGIDGAFSSFDATGDEADVFGKRLYLADFSLPGHPSLFCAFAAGEKMRLRIEAF